MTRKAISTDAAPATTAVCSANAKALLGLRDEAGIARM